LDIEVLGPRVVRYGSISATPTAAKPRTVLAMLAMHANEQVPVDLLINELWGNAPPSTAKTILQTYVMQLRKLISRAIGAAHIDEQRDAKRELVTMPGGYVLAASPDSVDRWHFERIVAAAHRARERGEIEAAARQFAEALDCWRGRALLDVQVGDHLRIDLQRLEEARLNAMDCRIEADLRLGRHHELLGELAALVQKYPSHEGLTAHLMVALYRSGRRSDALDVYQTLHTSLDELGLEPSPPLRRLHHTMLVCDRGSSELVDNRTATSAQPSARGTGQEQPSTPGRAGRIPVALASISWQANGMTAGG
jgi:DNA-binding SARP family transcriptional activator